MGEYAEMMLDGTCCSSCGEFLGRNEGYPVQCRSCRGDEGVGWKPRRKMGGATKKLLLILFAAGRQVELFPTTSEVWALKSRGYAEQCKHPNYWQLTAAGKAKAIELGAKATP